jgi:prepilin peptidase CpaA
MNSIAWWPSVAILALASIIDLCTRRIPNWLSVPFLLAGLAVRCITSGAAGGAGSVAGIVVAIGLFGLPCLLRGMGMGDLKLAMGVGAWIGPKQLLMAFIITGIVGGIHAVLYGLWRGGLGRSLDRTGDLLAAWMRFRVPPRNGRDCRDPDALSIPYAPAIAIGTILSFFTISPGS